MDDVDLTRDTLRRQLDAAIAADPLAAIATIVALQKETDQHLREAVRRAADRASWKEIATGLGVSKQAAHQRFRTHAKEVAAEIKTEHRSMRQSRRAGDTVGAAEARGRRDELAAGLRTAAKAFKEDTRS